MLEVAERCSVEIELGRAAPAEFPDPDGRDRSSTTSANSASRWLLDRYGRETPELARSVSASS